MQVKVYDTTLRDGAQSVGVTFSIEDKLRIVRELDTLGVHYIEGGWPGSNPKDEEFFERCRKMELKNAKIAAFSSTRAKNTKVEEDKTIGKLVESGAPVAAIFGKCWDLHVTEALSAGLEENLEMIRSSVEYMKRHAEEVIFDAEHFFDGYKNNREYAVACLKAAEEAGADWLVLCDTNGGTMPGEYRRISREVAQLTSTKLGTHAHNDSECAVANSLEAVSEGAQMVQGTINGFGERCGNANLCSILPNLSLKMGVETVPKEKLSLLKYVSHFVWEASNRTPEDHMPYVGNHAFAHKGGIHVSAVQKNPRTYEHIEPELVGNKRASTISELSGKSNVLEKLRKMNLPEVPDGELAGRLVAKVKELESRGYHFEGAEASFELLTAQLMGELEEWFTLKGYRVITWNNGDGKTWSEATIKASVPETVSTRMGHRDPVEHTSADGHGPVEALDKALRKVLEKFYPELRTTRLSDYKVRILNEEAGTSALTRVVMTSSDEDESWGTVGVSENILEASWQALVDSLIYKLKKSARSSSSGGSSKNKEAVHGTVH
ncbi:MAG: citramalate synthase [Spirochaetaceae bacterium]